MRPRVPSLARGLGEVIKRVVQFGMSRAGYSHKDITDTIRAANVESIASQLNQTTYTTARLLATEPDVLAADKSKLLPRNLIVSGRLKSGRAYRYLFTADVFDRDGKFITRKWFSMYANTQKAFTEVEEDITEFLEGQQYDTYYTFSNISFHHLMHQRGAKFRPVKPR